MPYSTGGKPVRPRRALAGAGLLSEHGAPVVREARAGTPLWQLQHYCGGTLIATDWVLTAAHCIDEDMVKAGYRVRLGAQDISKNEGWTYKIDRIVRHSQYGSKSLPAAPPNMYANDIALIHIVEDRSQPPRDPRVSARSRSSKAGPAGAEVTGTGWGKTEAVEGHAPSAVLMKVDLRVMETGAASNCPATARRRSTATSSAPPPAALDLPGRQRRRDHPHERRADGRRRRQLGQEALLRRRPAGRVYARRELPRLDQPGHAARPVEERVALKRPQPATAGCGTAEQDQPRA